MAGVASDAGGDSWSGSKGTCMAARAKHRAKDEKEGDKEEEVWHVRALRRGTDVSSRRQRRRRHVVRNALIRGHMRCSPYSRKKRINDKQVKDTAGNRPCGIVCNKSSLEILFYC